MPRDQQSRVFEDLFVLEIANNHWGRLERGIRIVEDFGKIVRFNNVKAAIKLQFRDVESFIHKNFKGRTDLRYVRRITETQIPKAGYATLVPSQYNRVRITSDWILSMIFGRDMTMLK